MENVLIRAKAVLKSSLSPQGLLILGLNNTKVLTMFIYAVVNLLHPDF